MQPIWRSCRLWKLFVGRAGVSATVMLVALAAVITAGDASAAGAAEPRLPSPIVELEPQRARLLAEIQCQPTVGKWLQLAEVQEELGRRYAWGVEEELGAARETAESAETAKSRPLGRSATSPLTPQPSNPSGGNPQPPDWSALERRTLEVLRCYDGYIEALEKAGELARRRIQEEGDLRPDLVEKYRRLLTELGPVLAQARANRPVVEAGRKVRLRVIGADRRRNPGRARCFFPSRRCNSAGPNPARSRHRHRLAPLQQVRPTLLRRLGKRPYRLRQVFRGRGPSQHL